MAKTGEVLSMLCPDVEYIAYGDVLKISIG